MTVTPVSPARAGGWPPMTLGAALLLVGVLCLRGLELALGAFGSAPAQPAPPVLGQPVTTSFGVMTVVEVEVIGGLTSGDLGGMTHGVQGFVPSGEAQVRVAVTVTNTGTRPVPLTPAQFGLLVGETGASAEQTGTTVAAMRLGPGASIDAAFSYVVPQAGQALAVRYSDPGSDAPFIVSVGVLGQAPPDADDHQPH